jgi:alkylhydroperoxidase/carboxymuconolactone decarboxylase family protein YurZ
VSADQVLASYYARGRSDLVEEHNFCREHAGDFFDKYLELVSRSFLYEPDDRDEASLPVKYVELIVATLLTSMRGSQEAVVSHLRRAFDNGLTEREAVEAFIAAQMPMGAQGFWQGVRATRVAAQISGVSESGVMARPSG